MKLEEAIHFLDEGLDIRRRIWKKAGIFVRKANDYLDNVVVPFENPVFLEDRDYDFAFVKGARLFMNYGEWSVPWFCGLSERRVVDWEVVEVS